MTKIQKRFDNDLAKIWQRFDNIGAELKFGCIRKRSVETEKEKCLTKIWQRFDKDLKQIWQRFNKPWAGIDNVGQVDDIENVDNVDNVNNIDKQP